MSQHLLENMIPPWMVTYGRWAGCHNMTLPHKRQGGGLRTAVVPALVMVPKVPDRGKGPISGVIRGHQHFPSTNLKKGVLGHLKAGPWNCVIFTPRLAACCDALAALCIGQRALLLCSGDRTMQKYDWGRFQHALFFSCALALNLWCEEAVTPRPHRVRSSAAQRKKWKIFHCLHSAVQLLLHYV